MIYRQRRNYENLNKVIFEGTGIFDTPRLLPTDATADSYIGFNYAKSCKAPANKGIHFFIDDYQFTRLWAQPDVYLDLLKKFRCVCTPDFSMYTDFPKVIQLYNHYRKHWLGAYWQMHGIDVIPTISWSDETSFDWCFDGEPENSVVAVSSVGTQMSERARRLFLLGYREMLSRLKPSSILFYGSVPEECDNPAVVPIMAFQESLKMRVNVREADHDCKSGRRLMDAD